MNKVERFWSHEAQNIRCVRESDYDHLRAALAPLAMAIVMPERMTTIPEGKTISYAAGYEDALDAVASLNRCVLSLELLERAARNLEIFNKRPVSMCRDCADCNGICQNTGLDCDVPALIEKLRTILRANCGSIDDLTHDSDCSTNNHGCPDLLGPCDCSLSEGARK